ncbi:hypothetical protein [Riemerella columbina]|uniref:hypothetical protein n=1 Tax=Riemerella columbina TaxID=103810 RepID=UPI00267063C7|nr:hypothetical protein [Riemerella columbina]WKS95709.1 hypothetical protein NYR17_02910 [Riemerella columbina]
MKKVILFSLLAVVAISCRGTEEELRNRLLPIKLTQTSYGNDGFIDEITEYNLSYNGNHLEKVEDNHDFVQTFTYQGNRIKSIEGRIKDNSNFLQTVTFEYDDKGNLTKELRVEKGIQYSKPYSLFIEYTYTIPQNNMVNITYNRVERYNGGQNYYETGTYEYTLNAQQQVIKSVGNYIERKEYPADTIRRSETLEIAYDNQKSIFKNVTGLNRLSYAEYNINGLLSYPHNIINTREYRDGEYYEDRKREIIYNEKGYPSEMTDLSKGKYTDYHKDDIFKIEYQ